jgi:hypothetical protein
VADRRDRHLHLVRVDRLVRTPTSGRTVAHTTQRERDRLSGAASVEREEGKAIGGGVAIAVGATGQGALGVHRARGLHGGSRGGGCSRDAVWR